MTSEGGGDNSPKLKKSKSDKVAPSNPKLGYRLRSLAFSESFLVKINHAIDTEEKNFDF